MALAPTRPDGDHRPFWVSHRLPYFCSWEGGVGVGGVCGLGRGERGWGGGREGGVGEGTALGSACQVKKILIGDWYIKTVWPSGLRRWLQAPVRKGVGSNPTAVNAPKAFITCS